MSRDLKPEIIQARRRDGSTLQVVVPTCRADVEMQPDIPSYVLATLAFSVRINGVRRWSDFTRQTLKRLEGQYGAQALRETLCVLLDDIATGFKPSNPIGILIHRLRLTANSGDMTI